MHVDWILTKDGRQLVEFVSKDEYDRAMELVARTQGKLDGLCLQIEQYLDNGVHLDEPTLRDIIRSIQA